MQSEYKYHTNTFIVLNLILIFYREKQRRYLLYGESLVNIKHGNDYDERYQFTGYEKDEETGLSYAGARYYWDKVSIPVSVDPHAESYPWITGYAYCSNNPVNRIDPNGMDDIYVFKNKSGEIATKTVETSDKEPNRLFMQDANATAYTKNRKAFDGMYFEQAMIPKEAYSEEDFENNNFFSFLGFGSSQFDKDRTEYVGNAGDYSDKNFFERTWESMKEEGFGNKAVEILSVVLARGKAKALTNGLKNGKSASKGTPHGDGGRTSTQAEKQIANLEEQLKSATGSNRTKIQQTIINIRKYAAKKAKGETHWRR